MGNLSSPAGRDLILCLRRILRLRAAAHAGVLLRVFSRMEDPRRGARYLGAWLRPLPPEAIVSVLASLLERTERREPGTEFAVETMLCGELRESWEKGLSRRVQSLARAEGHFDLAAMLLELPGTDSRLVPAGTKLSRDLQKVPLGVRKSMARRQDIFLMERLLADPDRSVIDNLLDNPRLTLHEVIRLAAGAEVREEVLEALAVHPRWAPRYQVKVALACNPATPVRISVGLLRLLMAPELRELSRDGRVSGLVSRRARELLRERAKREREPLFVLHVPGSSRKIPDDVMKTLAVSREQLMEELLDRTEAFVDEIFELDHPLAARVVFPWSRYAVEPAGVGPERLPLPSLQPLERRRLIDTYGRPHRRRLAALIARAVGAHGRCLLVECRSFPSSSPPAGDGTGPARPDICIGTDAALTPPSLAAFALGWFLARGYSVLENTPLSGASVPEGCRRGKGPGLRVLTAGLNRRLYMDEATGLRSGRFDGIREEVMDFLRELADRFEKGEF